MSIESLAIALHHSKAAGAAKLVLLGIANHDGDGGAWPAVSTLAKYANVDRRNVQRALEKLESLGEIRRVIQQGGDHSMTDFQRPNLYKILLHCPPDCDRSSQHRTSRRRVVMSDLDGIGPALMEEGAAQAPPGGAGVRGGGGAGATRTVRLTQQQVKEETRVIARGASTCAKGHELIDDRHCILGCAPAELVNA